MAFAKLRVINISTSSPTPSEQPKYQQSAVGALFKYLRNQYCKKKKAFWPAFEFIIEDYYVAMALKLGHHGLAATSRSNKVSLEVTSLIKYLQNI